MIRRSLILCGVVGSLLFVTTSPTWAQKGLPSFVTINGKVSQVTPTMISVVDDDGKPLATVTPSKTTQFSVSGPAEPDFLTTGTYVQFKAMVSVKKKEIVDPVKDVMVCEYDPKYPAGLSAEGGPDAAIALKKNPDAPIECLIRGKITANKNGEIQVNTSRETVTFELADGATIKVAVANPAYAKKGDLITVLGNETAKGVPKKTASQVKALKVDIKAANPFTYKKTPPGGADDKK